jgi:hypothetical protein
MKYLTILAATIFALPATAAEGHSDCSLRDLDGSWLYYSFAPSDNYTMTCSLRISSGTINTGSCVQSDGRNIVASGSLSIAAAMANHRDRQLRKPLKSEDQAVCGITGTLRISYPSINLTETLTNLTIAHDKGEIAGVGTNSVHLISVNFVRSGGTDDNNRNGNVGDRH